MPPTAFQPSVARLAVLFAALALSGCVPTPAPTKETPTAKPTPPPDPKAEVRELWQKGADAKHDGDIERARSHWREALELDPGNQALKDSLADLTSWEFRSDTDEMTSKTARYASVQSSNTFALGFPYEGEQRASLTVRRHPRMGLDILLQIERGQFNCGVSGTSFPVRFDSRQPREWGINEPADSGNTTTVFFADADALLERIRDARKMRVEASIYGHGNVVMEFDVHGFRWPKS